MFYTGCQIKLMSRSVMHETEYFPNENAHTYYIPKSQIQNYPNPVYSRASPYIYQNAVYSCDEHAHIYTKIYSIKYAYFRHTLTNGYQSYLTQPLAVALRYAKNRHDLNILGRLETLFFSFECLYNIFNAYSVLKLSRGPPGKC